VSEGVENRHRRRRDEVVTKFPRVAAPGAQASYDEAADESKRELLESMRRDGARIDEAFIKRHPLGIIRVSHDLLARHNIREGDAWRFTLDGDAEHGELAVLTFHDEVRGRSRFAAFLVIEGDHFCLRRGSALQCDGCHREPELLTVIGRVVRVERDGLPVMLKGLELRGLPFADDAAD
jgi:hypothetical protein